MIYDLLASATVAVQAASDSGGNGVGGIVYILLLAGFVFFGAMYLRYRNVQQRHHHEKETAARIAHMRTADDYVRSLRGVQNSRMSGANNTAVRGSLRKFF